MKTLLDFEKQYYKEQHKKSKSKTHVHDITAGSFLKFKIFSSSRFCFGETPFARVDNMQPGEMWRLQTFTTHCTRKSTGLNWPLEFSTAAISQSTAG